MAAISGGTLALGAAALAGGIGTFLATRHVADDYMEQRKTDDGAFAVQRWHTRSEQLKPGEHLDIPLYADLDADGYGFFGGLALGGAAAVAGISALALKPGLTPGMRGLAAVGALLGGVMIGGAVGGYTGGVRGYEAGDKIGFLDIDKQADEILKNFDATGDGKLSISDSGSNRIEYIRRNDNTSPPAYSGQHRPEYESIEHAAKAADTNGDKQVDAQELSALLGKYDADNDGLLSITESLDFNRDGNERLALTKIG